MFSSSAQQLTLALCPKEPVQVSPMVFCFLFCFRGLSAKLAKLAAGRIFILNTRVAECSRLDLL